MCGIIGFFHQKEAFSRMQKGLEIMHDRGKDGSGYYDGKVQYADSPAKLLLSIAENIIGHNLHAIVHTVPQPLASQRAALVSNCEIYNWKELAKEHKIRAKNDSELLFKLLKTLGMKKTLPLLRGVYAFAYWNENTVFLARDILGVKPLWYNIEGKKLSFSSEKKALGDAEELNPRQILEYSVKTGNIRFIERTFFSLGKKIQGDVLAQLEKNIIEAVRIRIPERKFGLLFSGGLDSVLLAKILKDLKQDFTCYIAATSKNSPDLIAAEEAAKVLGLPLQPIIVSEEETKEYLKILVPLIEDSNVIKVGVALPLYIASTIAKKERNKVIFSGSGADEVFGGYNRYKMGEISRLNQDCYSDLLKIYEKNCYRDDVITMHNNLELRVPFLDKELVAFALAIPPELKIKNGEEKYILRQVALHLGIPEKISARKKKAAQYGSGFDQALEKLAKKEKKSKSKYLEQFYPKRNVRLGALISGGKDSLYAAYTMQKQNYAITCAISIKSANPHSYMFHTPNIHLVDLQAEAMGIPLIVAETKGEKEKELKDLEKALKEAKEKYQIEGIVSGALYSNYQRERLEKAAEKIGLKVFSPLWHIDQEQEVRQLIREGFEIVLSSVAAEGLDKSWLGRVLTEKDVDRLVALQKKVGLNVAGEGGEYESLVLSCPLFKKIIVIEESEILIENQNIAKLVVKKAKIL
ncbi:MAG TPA: diphthine--ammonia ligase [Nanoarchaeota archaeon]|nr:diphthine--ammonia ligase [Candidatus Woesearchaeota archaeon]HIH58787.1 diphthine--ammonia ligase [Nanoarchaeota archaeon]HIJ05325.1 diphthine--ammonia ligase [Nanoarchaeota archaeon]